MNTVFALPQETEQDPCPNAECIKPQDHPEPAAMREEIAEATEVSTKAIPDTKSTHNKRTARPSTRRNNKTVVPEDEDDWTSVELEPDTVEVISSRHNTTPDTETVADYCESMQDGAEFPPLRVYKDANTGKQYTGDGRHRQVSYTALKIKIPAQIKTVENAQRRALKDSLSANNHHGLRRTGPDKHNVVQIVLDDPEWGRGTLREIATLTGTSHAFVRKIKKERDKAQKSQAIDSTTTTDEPPITSTPDMPGDLPEVLDEDESKHDAIGEPLAPPNDGGISVGKRVQLPPTTSSTLESILAQLRTLPLEGEDWSASDYDREILQHLIEECRRLNKTLTRKITFDVAPLRDFMDQRSLDMTTTGKLLGVSHAAVSRWLSGKSNPDGKSLTKILELVELSAEELQTRLEATRQAGDA